MPGRALSRNPQSRKALRGFKTIASILANPRGKGKILPSDGGRFSLGLGVSPSDHAEFPRIQRAGRKVDGSSMNMITLSKWQAEVLRDAFAMLAEKEKAPGKGDNEVDAIVLESRRRRREDAEMRRRERVLLLTSTIPTLATEDGSAAIGEDNERRRKSSDRRSGVMAFAM